MQNNTSNKLQESLDCNLAMVQRGESLMASSIIAIRNIFKEGLKTKAYNSLLFSQPFEVDEGKPEQWD